jgi:hypothetical protein
MLIARLLNLNFFGPNSGWISDGEEIHPGPDFFQGIYQFSIF